MMNVRSCSFLLAMMVNHVHNPNANAQRVRDILQTMKIHRLNHKFSCMVRANTDDLEQRRNFFKGPRLHYHSLRGAFSLVLRRLIANVGPVPLLRCCRLTCTEPLSICVRYVFHACLVSSWRKWHEQVRQDTNARLDGGSEGNTWLGAMRPTPAKQPRSIRWRSSRCF